MTFSVPIGYLAAGYHSLSIGLYNNKKTFHNEVSTLWIDDVTVSTTSNQPPNGALLREIWTDISGKYISDLTDTAAYPESPNVVDVVSLFESHYTWRDYYGQKIRGYIYPPITGLYTFVISGNHSSELYLSTDEHESTKIKIAYTDEWTSFHEWDKYSTQQSVQILLEAGKTYYVEALQKENDGFDHLSVAWTRPDALFEIIPGQYLQTFIPAPPLVDPSCN